MEDICANKSEYPWKRNIKEFDAENTLYDFVKKANEKNMDAHYAQYKGQEKTFEQLFAEVDKLASALYYNGVRIDDVIGVCLFSVPEVASVLLACNKIGAVSFWIDMRSNGGDILHCINNQNIKIVVIAEPVLPEIMKILDKTELRRVIVVSRMNWIGEPADIFERQRDSRIIAYSDYVKTEHIVDMYVIYKKDRISLIVQSNGTIRKSEAIAYPEFDFNIQIMNMFNTGIPFYEKKQILVCVPPGDIYDLIQFMYAGLVFGVESVFALEADERNCNL